jgi:hypothetical protein
LAQSGHGDHGGECLLLGIKRTSRGDALMSAFARPIYPKLAENLSPAVKSATISCVVDAPMAKSRVADANVGNRLSKKTTMNGAGIM